MRKLLCTKTEVFPRWIRKGRGKTALLSVLSLKKKHQEIFHISMYYQHKEYLWKDIQFANNSSYLLGECGN